MYLCSIRIPIPNKSLSEEKSLEHDSLLYKEATAASTGGSSGLGSSHRSGGGSDYHPGSYASHYESSRY